MTHREVQEQEIIERYVRHQLAPAERHAFQEHYFACAECFEQVQTTARFIAGVRLSARAGVLAESATPAPAWWASLFSPMFALAAAVLVLAVVGSWLYFRQPTTPPQELAHEQPPTPAPSAFPSPPREKAEPPQPTPLHKLPKLEEQRDLLAQNRPPAEAPTKAPVVLLESSRDASASSNQLTLPAPATSAILRLEVEPGSSFTSFQFQIFDSAKRLVTTATSGKASARGAVAVRVPAQQLQNGRHLVKCYGVKNGQRSLIGEYDLSVRRQ